MAQEIVIDEARCRIVGALLGYQASSLNRLKGLGFQGYIELGVVRCSFPMCSQ